MNVDAKQKNKDMKQRYAIQMKSQVDILDDGYRWRKYIPKVCFVSSATYYFLPQ